MKSWSGSVIVLINMWWSSRTGTTGLIIPPPPIFKFSSPLNNRTLRRQRQRQPRNVIVTSYSYIHHEKQEPTSITPTLRRTKSSSFVLYASPEPGREQQEEETAEEEEGIKNTTDDDDDDIIATTRTTTVDDDNDRWKPLSIKEKILLPIQLIFGIYVLMLLPSGIATRTYCGAKVMTTLPYEYILFFSLLILPRSYRYGKFAKPITKAKSIGSKKQQPKKATSIVEVITFISTLVGSHWIASYKFAAATLHHSASSSSKTMMLLAPKFFFILRSISTILVAMSGYHLDKSYDRVIRPHKLITTGPYSIIRHPIYTSYFILFLSTLLTLRSYACCLTLLVIASIFYKHRMDSEEKVLKETFGLEYEQYQTNVRWRLIPWLY